RFPTGSTFGGITRSMTGHCGRGWRRSIFDRLWKGTTFSRAAQSAPGAKFRLCGQMHRETPCGDRAWVKSAGVLRLRLVIALVARRPILAQDDNLMKSDNFVMDGEFA